MNHPSAHIDVAHLLPVLNNKLIDLLKSLTPDDWHKQTIAKLWSVNEPKSRIML